MKIRTLFLPIALICLQASPGLAAESTTVQVKTFEQLATSIAYSYPAHVVALRQSMISAQSTGVISHVLVEIGDNVKLGQKLAELDCRDYEINKERVMASLERRKINRRLISQQLKRAQKLFKANNISNDELDQRTNALDANSASIEEQKSLLKAALRDIEKCTISAPFAGFISTREASLGSLVNNGSLLFQITQSSSSEIELEIPPALSASIEQNPIMNFVTNNQHFSLSLRKILPLINLQTRLQPVRLSFKKHRPAIGSYGNVLWQSAVNYLPASLIQQRNGQFGVFIAKQDTASFQVLEKAQFGQKSFANLQFDSQVITTKLKQLQHGDAITIEQIK